MAKKETAAVGMGRYFEGLGRRKAAIARVRVWRGGNGTFAVNDGNPKSYFKILRYERAAMAPLKVLKGDKVSISAKVKGGGIMAQSEALRLGLSRALVKFDAALRPELKVAGFLSRRQNHSFPRVRNSPSLPVLLIQAW